MKKHKKRFLREENKKIVDIIICDFIEPPP